MDGEEVRLGVKTGKLGGKTLPREDLFYGILIEIILLVEMKSVVDIFIVAKNSQIVSKSLG